MAVARHSSYCTHKAFEGIAPPSRVALTAPVRPGMLQERRPVGVGGRLRGFIGGVRRPSTHSVPPWGILAAIRRLAVFRGPFQVFWSSFLYILRDWFCRPGPCHDSCAKLFANGGNFTSDLPSCAFCPIQRARVEAAWDLAKFAGFPALGNRVAVYRARTVEATRYRRQTQADATRYRRQTQADARGPGKARRLLGALPG
jgi:hypothetical protein